MQWQCNFVAIDQVLSLPPTSALPKAPMCLVRRGVGCLAGGLGGGGGGGVEEKLQTKSSYT